MRKSLPLIAVIVSLLVLKTAAAPTPKVSAALNVSALQPGKPAILAVVITIPDGYHAQSHAPLDDTLIKCEVELKPTPGIEIGTIEYPAGHEETYADLGKLNVYTGKVIIRVPITIAKSTTPGNTNISGNVTMQICNDKSCFPPSNESFSIDAAIVDQATPAKPVNPDLFPAATQPTTQP